MRVSSTTLLSSRGTLKSTRRNTRFSRGSKSRTVSLSISASLSPKAARGPARGSQALGHVGHEVGHAAALAPLVVVPGDDLHEVAAQDHGGGAVDDRGPAVAPEVAGDERLVAHAQDAREGPRGGGPEGLVEALHGRRPGQLSGEVDDAHGRCRDAQAEAVELAFQVGDDE